MSHDAGHSEHVVKKQKLWGGRFSGATDPLMDKFNASLPFDKILYSADITASQVFFLLSSLPSSFPFSFFSTLLSSSSSFVQAYAEALLQQKILTAKELKSIVDGLELVRKEV